MRQPWVLLLSISFVLSACQPTAPQRPSYRSGAGYATTQVDSALLGMIQLNERMREEADEALTRTASPQMTREESGYWIQGLHDIETGLQNGEHATIHWQVYTLDSVLLQDVKESIQVGQWNTLPALTQALPMLHRGDSVLLLVPWYLGYGVTGNQNVPGYANLAIRLIVLADY